MAGSMVAMKTSVSKTVRCAHTATAEITTKSEDTTTSRTAIHLRGTDMSVVVSFAVVKFGQTPFTMSRP